MPANSSDSPTDSGAGSAAAAAAGHSGPDEPRHHRTVLFYGQAGWAAIRRASVTVVGLGGVGGHAAVNLARSGIGGLRLVDFDQVTESSLNRSPFAGPGDVGRPKTEVLAAYLAAVCPETRVTVATERCGPDNLAELVPVVPPARPDLVLDAIDAVGDKVALLAWCRLHDIPVIAGLGAAGKRDVGLVRTGPIDQTRVCPLARQVRLGLREQGTPLDIPCVWSLEKAAPGMSRPLPSQMSLPGVFGYALASLALDLIAREEQR